MVPNKSCTHLANRPLYTGKLNNLGAVGSARFSRNQEIQADRSATNGPKLVNSDTERYISAKIVRVRPCNAGFNCHGIAIKFQISESQILNYILINIL